MWQSAFTLPNYQREKCERKPPSAIKLAVPAESLLFEGAAAVLEFSALVVGVDDEGGRECVSAKDFQWFGATTFEQHCGSDFVRRTVLASEKFFGNGAPGLRIDREVVV